jgi:hypothetical protein
VSAEKPLDSQSDLNLTTDGGRRERNWVPLGIALALVLVVVVGGFMMRGRPKPPETAVPINAAADPYAANLPLSGLAMSESSNLAGGKVTYIDGHVANNGDRTVTGVTVQVLFRNGANEVAQNQAMPLTVIRMRDPYVDTAPLSLVPLQPAAQKDFRLIFDSVSPEWAGTLPEIRVLHVELK